jgi:hypothetical protein
MGRTRGEVMKKWKLSELKDKEFKEHFAKYVNVSMCGVPGLFKVFI